MPRQSRATIDTLTHQLETTTAADEPWRDQTIPTFDEPTNGHVPEGIRPSERCGTPSELGISCGFKAFHAGRHSWQPEQPAVDVATMQAQLPGTPEPEQHAWAIPTESSFAGKDFQSAPGLKTIGEHLIQSKPSLEQLDGVEIRYLWKRRGGTSGGNPKLGALQRPGGLLKYFTGGVTFVAWLAADNCRDLQLTPEQLEANLHHQLLHADIDPDDDDGYRIRSHDFEGFVEELDAHGAWTADLREMHAHVARLPLEQAIDEAADSDADEGEESE